jgi:hypothetical protein
MLLASASEMPRPEAIDSQIHGRTADIDRELTPEGPDCHEVPRRSHNTNLLTVAASRVTGRGSVEIVIQLAGLVSTERHSD